jgi:hypothetical protein
VIIRGVIARRIALNIFAIETNEEEFKIVFRYQIFPEEYARLCGHVCEEVAGLKPGIGCSLDIENHELMDVKFDVPDVVSLEEETSRVINILADGEHAFLERACKCTVHISGFAISTKTHRFFDGFDLTQLWRHKVHVLEGRVEAFEAQFAGMAEGEAFHTGLLNDER